jgi:hypothetical protein
MRIATSARDHTQDSELKTNIFCAIFASHMSDEDNIADVPPHVKILQIILGQWVAGAVSALAKLGVPDHLESGPKSAEELAAEIGAQAEPLYRLMRATASVGVLLEGPDGKFAQTPMSNALRTKATPALRHVAMFTSDEWHVRGWGKLDHTIRTGERPVESIYGMPLFEYFGKNPEVGATFNHGMTDMSTMDAPAVADAYDFSGIKSVTDVGGGHGLLLATILQRNPTMKGTLYDLPQVIQGVAGGPTETAKNRITFVAGNMFESVPAGADAYIMKYIIHDWPDDLCIKILKGCRAGVNAGGKLLVVDSVVPADNTFTFGKIADLEMLLFPGGKERTEKQFRDLFAAAGWKVNRILPTASHVSIIEGVPA